MQWRGTAASSASAAAVAAPLCCWLGLLLRGAMAGSTAVSFPSYALRAVCCCWGFLRVVSSGGLAAELEAFVGDAIPALELTDLLDDKICRPVCDDGLVATPLSPPRLHRPMANGCGPQSGSAREPGDGRYQVKNLTDIGLLPCCNAHDLCFQTCGLSHAQVQTATCRNAGYKLIRIPIGVC